MLSFLDAIFVPFSLFLTVGYHAYLWYCLKKKPSRTTRGINLQTIRRTWFLKIVEVSPYMIYWLNEIYEGLYILRSCYVEFRSLTVIFPLKLKYDHFIHIISTSLNKYDTYLILILNYVSCWKMPIILLIVLF